MTPRSASPGPASVLLHDVAWATYERLLEDTAEQHVRMTYDRGDLELMSALPEHEWWKVILRTVVTVICQEYSVPHVPYGSTTWRNADVERGLEADESYYVQNVEKVLTKKEFGLKVDPPPDLALEIEVTRRLLPRLPVYADLGITEVWRFDGTKLEFLKLRLAPMRGYDAAETSVAFPFISRSELERFLATVESTEMLSFTEKCEQWVRSTGNPPPPPRKS